MDIPTATRISVARLIHADAVIPKTGMRKTFAETLKTRHNRPCPTSQRWRERAIIAPKIVFDTATTTPAIIKILTIGIIEPNRPPKYAVTKIGAYKPKRTTTGRNPKLNHFHD